MVKIRFAVLSGVLLLVLLLVSEMSMLEMASICFTLFTFLVLLYEIGRTIAIRELMTFVAALQMVLAPTLELNEQPDAMALTSEDYLSYALPAMIMFAFGLNLPLVKTKPHIDLLQQAKEYLVDKERTSLILLGLGIVSSVLYDYAPIQIKAIIYLFAICLYASVLYTHYTDSRFKYITSFIAMGLLLYITVRDGMFGHMIFWVTLYILIVTVTKKKKISFRFKLSLVSLGVFFIILAQSIKMEYRVKTWGDNVANRKADPALMLNLMNQRLNDLDFLLGHDHLAAIYHRMNQGSLIAETMAYVPAYEPFADGDILAHFVYPFIPRIIWNDKPITGGEANMLRFTPFIPNGISSSNISPFGEAYANFGRTGGIIFLLFFGLLFNLAFCLILRIAEKTPTVLLWLPGLFTGCLTLETDVLSTWGSLVTSSTFLILFWQLTKRLSIHL